MKFEKINENKIRITLTSKDLEDKCVDFHSFMASPIESQELFLDMLDEAEEKIGFYVNNYNLRIEAIAISNESFILTITKIKPKEIERKKVDKKFTVKRKKADTNISSATYCFNSFDDFCNFLDAIHINHGLQDISKSAILYQYKNSYYLVLSNINVKNPNKLIFYSYITEFARYTNNSNVFVSKLKETGKVIIKNNALKFNLNKPDKKIKN